MTWQLDQYHYGIDLSRSLGTRRRIFQHHTVRISYCLTRTKSLMDKIDKWLNQCRFRLSFCLHDNAQDRTLGKHESCLCPL